MTEHRDPPSTLDRLLEAITGGRATADGHGPRSFTITVPDSVYIQLEGAARARGLNVPGLIGEILADAVAPTSSVSRAEIDAVISTMKRLRRARGNRAS